MPVRSIGPIAHAEARGMTALNPSAHPITIVPGVPSKHDSASATYLADGGDVGEVGGGNDPTTLILEKLWRYHA
jgi:hypothetical protein